MSTSLREFSTSSTTTEPNRTSKYYPIRQSTRLRLEMPLIVKRLGSEVELIGNCTTVVVNAHGCGITAPRALDRGTRISLEISGTRKKTTACVVDVVPLDQHGKSWLLGLALDKPGNFWGIEHAPSDWQIENASNKTQTDRDTSVASASGHVSGPARRVPSSSNVKGQDTAYHLAAISLGACYLQGTATFPRDSTVAIRISIAKSERCLTGTVRVEHAQSGMGIEFTDRDRNHRDRIEGLIRDLSMHEGQVPQVSVSSQTCKSPGPLSGEQGVTQAVSATPQMQDSLLGLVLVGNTLKRTDFLRELQRQSRSRSHTKR